MRGVFMKFVLLLLMMVLERLALLSAFLYFPTSQSNMGFHLLKLALPTQNYLTIISLSHF